MNKKTKIIIIVLALIAVGVGFFFLHPHTYTVSEQTPATCTENGSTTYKCWCGKSYTEEVPAIGHNYVKEITKESTCTENGVATFTCSVCGDSYTEDIISTGHNYVASSDNIDADNCVSYTCSVCGDSYKENNHSYSYINEANKKSYICDKCNFELFHIDLYDESKDMYTQSDCDIYEGPDAKDFDKVGSLKINEAIKVTGVVEEYNDEDTFWLAVEYKGQEYFISGAYLSDTKVATQTNTGSNNTSNSGQQSQTSQNNSSSNSGQQSSAPAGKSEKDFWGGSVNNDYSTSGEAGSAHVSEGANWAP